MIDRYDSPVGWEKKSDDGDLVKYEDYQRLEADNVELRNQLSGFSSATPSYIKGPRDELEETQFRILVKDEDNQYMINLAGEAIGTDPSLRSSACVKVIVDHIKTLRADNARLREKLFRSGAMLNPPCFNCGYNGEGYFNPKFHPCAEQHHKADVHSIEMEKE